MSGGEVRRRLSACRWAKEDRADPFFAEALDQAAREPALAEWWAEERALDEMLARKLSELAVPLSLRGALDGA